MFGAWSKAAVDMAMLGLEAQGVVVQRLTMFAFGNPNSQAEAHRMVTEKVFAAGEAAMLLATGATNEAVIGNYRRKVRANARRLAKH